MTLAPGSPSVHTGHDGRVRLVPIWQATLAAACSFLSGIFASAYFARATRYASGERTALLLASVGGVIATGLLLFYVTV